MQSFFGKSDNYYYLSLLKEDENKWSIHGLWPQYTKDKYPTYCREVTFDVTKLDLIMNDLNKYWFSTEEKNTDFFWKHEWKKHGSCMFNKCDEFFFFNKALELYEQAIVLSLPNKYYNKETGKCLIPITLDFKLPR